MSRKEFTLKLSDVLNGDSMDDDEYDVAEEKLDSGLPASLPRPFSAETLERELASLLNEDTPAELTRAAAQQRQAQLVTQHSQLESSGSEQLGSLTGLAAVLHAANLQAARQAGKPQQPVQLKTRTAPSFHTLTQESAPPLHQEIAPHSYFYGEDDPHHPEPFRSPPDEFLSSPPRDAFASQPGTPGGLDDFEDIMNHFAAQENNPSSPRPHVVPHFPPAPVFAPAHDIDSTNSHFPEGFMDDFPPEEEENQASTSTSTGPGTVAAKKEKKKRAKATPKEKAGSVLYECEEEGCDRSFTRKSDVQRHMRIHTGERPYPCSHPGCNKAFIQNSALQVHMRVHSGEKPHTCEYPGCKKTFGDSSSLARHRRTHTGKRPYKCESPECDKTFTRRETLINHMKIHDPEWVSNPNVRYNFKPKKRKIGDVDEEDEDDDDLALKESVRTISAIFCGPGGENMGEVREGELEMRVAAVSAEISAAIAQAQDRGYEGVYEYAGEELQEEEGDESEPDTIGPNTHPLPIPSQYSSAPASAPTKTVTMDAGDSDSDDDTFMISLRPRQDTQTGKKRKRT